MSSTQNREGEKEISILNKPVDGLKQHYDAIHGVKFRFSRLLDSGVGVKLDGILFNM